MFCRVIITILLFYTASQISFASEQINGAWYPDKVQRNIDKIKPDKKIEILNVCKNSNNSKDVLIYSTKKTIDIYTKCRIIGTGGYNTYLRNQSDEIASKLCVKYNSKAVYRGKAKHTKSLFKGALDLSLGNIQVVGNSYVCETLPIVKKNPPVKNPKPPKVPIESDSNLSSIFIICLFGFFIFLILIFINSKFTENNTKDLGKNKKKLDPSRPITSFEERFNQFSISNKNVSDDKSIKPEVEFSNKTKIVKATILSQDQNIKKRATFFTNSSNTNNFFSEILPGIVVVIAILFSIFSYINKDSTSATKRTESSPKLSNIVTLCKHYAKKDFNLDFNGDSTVCYAFLNEYKNSINNKLDNMWSIYSSALQRTTTKNKTAAMSFVNQEITRDCRYKSFNSSHNYQYVIDCIAAVQLLPKILEHYTKLTNNVAKTQQANAIRQKNLMSFGIALSQLGRGLLSNETKNRITTHGFTKVCYYDDGTYATTISSTSMCPFTTRKTIDGFTQVCIEIGSNGTKAITLPSSSFCPLGYEKK